MVSKRYSHLILVSGNSVIFFENNTAAVVELSYYSKSNQFFLDMKYLKMFFFLFFRVCAPSESFHLFLYDDRSRFANGLLDSGFICTKCGTTPKSHNYCRHCKFCMPGTFSNRGASCFKCPAGNCAFYVE